MASRFISPQPRPVRHHRAPWRRPDPRPVPPTISALLATIPSLPRPLMVRLTSAMIDHLDLMDGDPDIELNGDEEDGLNSEDEFKTHFCSPIGWSGAGCPVSDPDYAVDDDGEDDRDGDV